MADVTDATFERDVLERSTQVPVVVDLWAPWCGPCKTLGPIIEDVVAATEGRVELAKVNVDENPQVAAAFRVQSIPAVYAVRDRQVVDHFIGALPEHAVATFIGNLDDAAAPSEADQLVAQGDEASLRSALLLEPGHVAGILALAGLLIGRGDDGHKQEALSLLERIPDTPEVRRLQALARVGDDVPADGVDDKLVHLLDRVKDDETARQEYLDILEVLGPDDPRTPRYRRALSSRLF
jgi:putative thioredoxin